MYISTVGAIKDMNNDMTKDMKSYNSLLSSESLKNQLLIVAKIQLLKLVHIHDESDRRNYADTIISDLEYGVNELIDALKANRQ